MKYKVDRLNNKGEKVGEFIDTKEAIEKALSFPAFARKFGKEITPLEAPKAAAKSSIEFKPSTPKVRRTTNKRKND